MNLNVDIKDLKGQIQELLGKFSKSPSPASSTEESKGENTQKPKDGLQQMLKPLTKIFGKYTYEHETVLGVDLTPHYIRVCQMKNSYDKWILSNLASSCMESQFRKSDIRESADLYVENLRELIKKNDIKAKNVAFSLPTSSSIVKIVNVPDMEDEDFAQAAEMGSIWESMVNLEGDISEYSVYYKILRHNPAPEIEETPVESSAAEEAAIETPIEEVIEEAAAETPAEPIAEEIINDEPDNNTVAAAEGAPTTEAATISDTTEEIAIAPQGVVAEETPTEEVVAEQPTEVASEEIPAGQTITEVASPEEAPVAEEPAAEEIPVEAAPAEIPTEEVVPAEEVITDEIAIEPAPQEGEIPTEDIGIAPDATDNLNIGIEPEIATEPEPEAIAGPTMDVLFIASKIEDIMLHADIIRQAGLNPILADVGCLSLKHAFESNPKNFQEVREPYAFMEFGPDENYVFIVNGYNTDVYNIFVSDEDKNAMIYNADNVDLINAFAQNTSTQIVQILDDHKAKYKTETINHLFVSSSAPLHVDDASVEPLIKIFVREASKNLTGRKVTECNFLSHIAVPEKFAKKVNAEGDISAWAGTVGIATRKLDIFGHEEEEGRAPINMVNLLPGSNDNKKVKRTSIMSTFCLSIVFLLTLMQMGISYISVNSKNNALAGEIKSMGNVEALYNTKLSESQKLSLIVNQVNSLDDVKDSLPSNQSSILSAYRHVTQVIPEGVWLSEVNYIVPSGIEIKGSSINDGNILTFIKRLNEGKEFEKIALKTMEMEKAKNSPASGRGPIKGEVKKFTLEGIIRENVSAHGLEMLSKGVKN